jgi:hypothetical protein
MVLFGKVVRNEDKTGRGVTANMLLLGRSDSGFESRRPDKVMAR